MGFKISIKKEDYFPIFNEDEYVIEIGVNPDYQYRDGDLMCKICPWGIYFPPLCLHLVIRADGSMIRESWDCSGDGNYYLHTFEKPDGYCAFHATAEQISTVSGLFSGRLRFEGLKIAVGGTVQRVCPIDLEKEEELINHTIYLA